MVQKELTSVSAFACSKSVTWWPTLAIAIAAAMPPSPAPTIPTEQIKFARSAIGTVDAALGEGDGGG